MITIATPCALRTHRRTWGLSQRELADLLGFESPTHVSRLEHGKRTPGLETALACSNLFGVPLDELFPHVAETIDDALRERIARVKEGTQRAPSAVAARKCELFDRALSGVLEQASAAEV